MASLLADVCVDVNSCDVLLTCRHPPRSHASISKQTARPAYAEIGHSFKHPLHSNTHIPLAVTIEFTPAEGDHVVWTWVWLVGGSLVVVMSWFRYGWREGGEEGGGGSGRGVG